METPLAPRPQRDSPLEEWAKNAVNVATVLSGATRPADPSVRPMAEVSLSDMAEIYDGVVAPMRRELPDLGAFPVWSARRSVALERGLAVPADHLWWFVAPGDTVLLSDRVTHHFTTVGGIDRPSGTVSFVDAWPDEFFLRAGHNTLGITADGTRITRADFAKVAVGIVTIDRAALFGAYLAAFPRQAVSEEVHCRIGHAITNVGSDRLLPLAACHFDVARRLARKHGDTDLEMHAAARLLMSATCGHAVCVAAGLRAEGEATKALLDAVPPEMADAALRQLTPDELCRTAFCVSHVGGHDTAEALASRAVSLDPGFADGHLIRARARLHLGRPREAIDDLTSCLDLVDASLRDITKREQGVHRMDVVTSSRLVRAKAMLEQRRATACDLYRRASAVLQAGTT